VVSHEFGDGDDLTVVFDDQKVTAQKIVNYLKAAGLSPSGDPVMIE
jgi:hypothetical protein